MKLNRRRVLVWLGLAPVAAVAPAVVAARPLTDMYTPVGWVPGQSPSVINESARARMVCVRIPFTIEHSGRTWTTTCLGPNGAPVWPVDEYLARIPYPPEEAERIRRLNPDGQEEGTLPLGVSAEDHWRAFDRRGVMGGTA